MAIARLMAFVARHVPPAPARAVKRTLPLALSLVLSATSAALAQLYEQPVLVIDPGRHTAPIRDVSVDAAGRIGVTGSWDKTVRIWSLRDGELKRTIRMPVGAGELGKIHTVAAHPDGAIVAAGGYTTDDPEEAVYLFETDTGKIAARIWVAQTKGATTTTSLAFSPDGRYLAVGLSANNGIRVYDRERQWSEAFRDPDYAGAVQGVTFSRDGWLATTSYDGKVRLYDSAFKLTGPPATLTAGKEPFRIAFSPDTKVLAVGYNDVPRVSLLDGRTLALLPEPNVQGLNNGSLLIVGWSKDGSTLFAGGRYWVDGTRPVIAWSDAGRGAPRVMTAGKDSVAGLAALPDGGLFVATQDPIVLSMKSNGAPLWNRSSPKADFRNQEKKLQVSEDGAIVDFGFEQWGTSPLRFDLNARKLTANPPNDGQTMQARQTGLAIEKWNDDFPVFDGNPLELSTGEKSESLAIRRENVGFVLGSEWNLQAFDTKGKRLWRRNAPSYTWAVNVSGDDRLVVAAYGDGTIRWHRSDDGRELLALYVLEDKQNWVAWTPEGFYGATPSAFSFLQWQVNRGFDVPPGSVPVNAIPKLRRPDALPLVLRERETARALGIADLVSARRDVQAAAGSAKAPGARLHVLAIGISDYGEKARNLKLNFAAQDAQDVAAALVNTQAGGLYAEVKPMFLRDGEASRDGIFDALSAMERNMAGGAGQDFAVVMFSGHGTMIDNQFYLVPSGSDSSTMSRLKSSSIPATEFRSEIEKIARNGRVLVLLDACRSAGLIGGPANSVPAADALRAVMNAGNVTVLTSSTQDKVSREDEKWGHGAFTKAMLDALSSSEEVDTNHDGVISMSEFTAYLEKRLTDLTNGYQQLGLDQRFQGNIFVAGL